MILGFKLLCVIIFNAGRSEHLICVSLKYQSSCILNLSVHFYNRVNERVLRLLYLYTESCNHTSFVL